jgi:hypothetical protein
MTKFLISYDQASLQPVMALISITALCFIMTSYSVKVEYGKTQT